MGDPIAPLIVATNISTVSNVPGIKHNRSPLYELEITLAPDKFRCCRSKLLKPKEFNILFAM